MGGAVERTKAFLSAVQPINAQGRRVRFTRKCEKADNLFEKDGQAESGGSSNAASNLEWRFKAASRLKPTPSSVMTDAAAVHIVHPRISISQVSMRFS